MIFSKKNLVSAKKFFIGSIILFICVQITMFPDISSDSIKSGINCCLNILIPSLFPFIFIATFTVQSQIFLNPGKLVSKLTKFLFYLPGYTAPVIILSLVGGYPVGAKGIKTLFDKNKINTEQLNRMMCFCVNAGPGFLISLIGTVLINNKFMGIIMLLSQILSSIIIGIGCGIYSKSKNFSFYVDKSSENSNIKLSESFIESTSSVCQSIMQICTLVIIFSFFISTIENSGIIEMIANKITFFDCNKNEIYSFITSFLEVTTGCVKASQLRAGLMIIAFAVGHGGICTHIQIASMLKNCNFDFKKFCLFRFVNAFFSLISVYISSKYLPIHSEVFSNLNGPLTVSNSSTLHGSIALILLSLYFVMTVNLNQKSRRFK